ncbi:transglutaminase domain-containing protein [Methanobrevibacter sp.]|uniref:transglutaminase domain-containing protein n=2 Tax=Methanobrevibacter TaxID=2172 RepID=UPI002FD98091
MKFIKKKFLVFILLIFFMTLLSLTAVSAADYTVTGNSYDDIQNSVDVAGNNDRLLIGTGTYSSSGNAIEIDGKNITIQGQSNSNRAKLDGRGLYRTIIVRDDASLTLRYIDFVNGTSISYHALNIRGSLLIENCSFKNCYGDSGSAIYVFEDSNSAIIRDCTFINNHAANTGDNSYTVGGAVISQGSDNFKVINCYFENNTALTYGGAIGLRNNGLGAEITNCTFVNNFAPDGGAIYVLASVTITGSTFKNNRASNNGGAIFTTGSNILNIFGSFFESNRAINGGALYITVPTRINSSTFKSNLASNIGGVIFASGSNGLNISNSKFESNRAKNGGALYITVTTRITSSNFKSNLASSNGGAVYSKNILNISKSTISKNSAAYGSGVYSSSTLRVDSSSLLSNSAKFIKIVISAPNSAKSGSNVAIKSGLVYGDNVAGAFYTTNGNIFVNGKKSTVSNYSPDKKIILKFNGKSVSGSAGSNGIATFGLFVKVSKTTTYKATVSITQGSKIFSTSKSIKFTVDTKSNSNNNIKSASTVKIKNTASSSNDNGIITSTDSITTSRKYKEILLKDWTKTKDSNNNFKYPNKKFRWVKIKNLVTTTKYTNLGKNPSFPKGAKVTFSNNKKDATLTATKVISTNYVKILNPYLEPSTFCDSDDPKIMKWAKKLAKGKKNKAAADKILGYVQKRIRYELYSNTKYGSYTTWEIKWGNCVDSSHLTVALLRAAGIPAQYEHAGLYNKIGHAWPLVYVKYKGKYQWLPGEATNDYPESFNKNAVKWFFVKKLKNKKPDYNGKYYDYTW